MGSSSCRGKIRETVLNSLAVLVLCMLLELQVGGEQASKEGQVSMELDGK
jgi:hypothetical protein